MNKLKELNLIDYIVFAAFAIVCFLLFQNISIKNMGMIIVYLACAVVVYGIALVMDMDKPKARLCAYASATMPLAFYCQFIMGNSEALMLLFVLAGFYFWLKEDEKLFLLCFALAFMFDAKAFPVFAVLLLLRRKELGRILINMALFLVPSVIKLVINLCNEEYRESFQLLNINIAGSSINLGGNNVNLTIFVAVIIIGYAYIKTTDSKEDMRKWAIYLIGLMMFALFGMGSWEPQYLLLAAPFFTIGAFMHKDTKIFMVLDILIMLFFVLFVVNEYADSLDSVLFHNGIFKDKFVEDSLDNITMRELLVIQDKGLILSFISVLILAVALFKHPKYQLEDIKTEVNKGTIGFIRTRFIVGVLIFLAPALVCFLDEVVPPYTTLCTDEKSDDVGPLISNRQQSEVFIANMGVLSGFEFCIGTYDRENNVELTIKVTDASTEEVLFSKTMDVSGYDDAEWVYVDTDDIELKPGNVYRLDFVCYEAEPDECVTIYKTEDLAGQMQGYAFIDGQRQEYHLCLKILEKYLQTESVK